MRTRARAPARETASDGESRPTRRSRERRTRTAWPRRTEGARCSPRDDRAARAAPPAHARRPRAGDAATARERARRARSASASRLDPLSDHGAGRDQQDDPDEPGDETFRHRADVSERPAAAIVRMLRVEDIADDRV